MAKIADEGLVDLDLVERKRRQVSDKYPVPKSIERQLDCRCS
jgi:hypothetical protein